jgi:hypothetical protein
MTEKDNQTKRVDPRASRREARRRRLQLIAGDRPTTVKVFAANETMREVLRHPRGGRFRDTIDQAVEWPNDTFTTRRIAEGSVRTDGPGSGDQEPDDPSLNAREQAAARKEKNQAPKEAARNGGSATKKPAPEQPSPAA